MNGILAQVASNLKTSCEVTDAAFSKRTGEVKHAKGKLEEQKSETIVKIQELENTLQSLEQAIMAKQGPLATCQAKIHQRRLRPGAEYCHDEVDDHLAREQRNLLEIINKLEAGLGQVINKHYVLVISNEFEGFPSKINESFKRFILFLTNTM